MLPLLCVCAFTATAHALKNPVVRLTDGSLVEGKAKEFGPVLGKKIVHSFLGIPFAKPPTGALRFKAAVPPTPWGNTTYVAHKQGAPCSQLDIFKGERLGQEDCLTLDVTVPHQCISPKEPCAVMNWIYGGAWELGSVEEFGIYDPRKLAEEHGVIIVAGNYRLDVLGWLALEELQTEDPDDSYGSYGFRDQVMVLRWIRDNIHVFGGDPMQVTIFGESAGGFSVCTHLASPGSSGLFSNAIMQSGGCDEQGLIYLDGADAKAFGDTYVRALKCNYTAPADTLLCLRRLSVKDIMKPYVSWFKPGWPNVTNALNQSRGALSSFLTHAQNNVDDEAPHWPMPLPAWAPMIAWSPVVDGSDVSLPASPYKLFSEGKVAVAPTGKKVNIIMGTNKDEGSIFMIAVPIVVPELPPSTINGLFTDKEVLDVLDLLIAYQTDMPANAADQMNAAYPKAMYPPGKGNNVNRLAAVLKDLAFTCSTRRSVRVLADLGYPVWLYHFEHQFALYKSMKSCGHIIWDGCGDFHASELSFVWQHAKGLDILPRDKAMQDLFGLYWTNLAKFGNPNGVSALSAPALRWPSYNRSTDQHMILKHPGLAVGTGLRAGTCDLFDDLGHFK